MKKIILFLLIPVILTCDICYSQWQQTGSYAGNVLPFAVKDSILISGTYGNGVYITNDGINWQHSSNGMTNTQIISLEVCGINFFAGSETGGVYRSSDNGLNWIPVNEGLSNLAIHTLCSANDRIYSGTNSGIHLSTDFGNNWNRISYSPVGNVIYALVSFGDTVFTGTSTGVFYSINGGGNWNNINSGISGAVYCLMKNSSFVYAGTSSSGVYKTSNLGVNWIHINSGLPSNAVRGICSQGGKIFAATYGGGIYYSINEGTNWYASNTGLSQLVCYNIKPFQEFLYCGTTTGIFRRPEGEFTYITRIDNKIINKFKLLDNYPNPFNPSTSLEYEIPEVCFVTLGIYDIRGKEILTLINEKQHKGRYSVSFNAEGLNSGVYFYRLMTEKFCLTKKMVLLK
ncbi:MAG: T9SS type A sorting domain-containing protein [Ignavibacteria bacterium]